MLQERTKTSTPNTGHKYRIDSLNNTLYATQRLTLNLRYCARGSCTGTPASAGKIRPWERGPKTTWGHGLDSDVRARPLDRRENLIDVLAQRRPGPGLAPNPLPASSKRIRRWLKSLESMGTRRAGVTEGYIYASSLSPNS
ncbi:hypothetical protein M514_10654 [Trichuris suis]|uniref:Uncharacterized protein n=1 Tax=Trichuris suis TaxID=68888 RepID=A0A085MXZ9_9BILA|nr:hypothetical protein M513_10654 [Trichuris suis]KFD62095.1 hypothetical protein M514_10654 [Trichuris suis]